jgi:hypothetical protein
VTIAYVKNADGSGGLVQNTFRDSAGAIHTLGNDFTDDAGVTHTVFNAQLPTIMPDEHTHVFKATDNVIFKVGTDERIFTA